MRAAYGRRRPILLFTALALLSLLEACSLATGFDPKPDTPSPGQGMEPSLPDAGDEASYVYIRAASSGDGSSWAAARSSFPVPLERGKTYWIGPGSYAAPNFDSIAEGAEWVQLRRASSDSHGSDAGWTDAYAEGLAVLPPMEITAPHVYIDGGSTSAMKCLGTYQSTVVDVASDNVILRLVDIDGNFQMDSSGYHIGGAGTGLTVEGDDVSILGCAIHGVADDAVVISNSSGLLFQGNKVFGMYGRGTGDGTGPCYNGHSDGLELVTVSDSRFDGNLILAPSEGMTTAAVFFADWMSSTEDYNRNLVFSNNVFYKDNSFAMYIIQAEGIKLYNNTIWGNMEGGPWGGGLEIGNDVSGLELVDNILLFVRFAHWDSAVQWDPSKYSGSHNLFGKDVAAWPLQDGDIVAADPGFEGIPDADSSAFVTDAELGDFALRAGSPAVDAGTAIGAVTQDAAGSPRPSGYGYDIGALER